MKIYEVLIFILCTLLSLKLEIAKFCVYAFIYRLYEVGAAMVLLLPVLIV